MLGPMGEAWQLCAHRGLQGGFPLLFYNDINYARPTSTRGEVDASMPKAWAQLVVLLMAAKATAGMGALHTYCGQGLVCSPTVTVGRPPLNLVPASAKLVAWVTGAWHC